MQGLVEDEGDISPHFDPQDRIPGGVLSRAWLLAEGLRVLSGQPEMPQSLAAFKEVRDSGRFPGFDFELVEYWDPRLRRVIPQEERRPAVWCTIPRASGSGRERTCWVAVEEVFEPGTDVPKADYKLATTECAGDRTYIYGWVGPSGWTLQRFVRFRNYPVDAEGKHFSMADLVRLARGTLKAQASTFSAEAQRRLGPVLGVKPLGNHLGRLLVGNIGERLFHLPRKPKVVQALASWLEAAQRGDEVTLVSPVCPDWGTHVEHGHERYDFAQLGTEVGLVARRAIPGIQAFGRFARTHGINLKIAIVMGDFEGLSPETQERLGIDLDEFRHRSAASLEAMRLELIRRDPDLAGQIACHQILDLAGGVDSWLALVSEKLGVIQTAGLAQALRVAVSDVEAMARARRDLYERWHGVDVDPLPILAAQGAEYAAMGEVALNEWDWPLVMGADQRTMHVFYGMVQDRALPGISMRGDAY